MKVIQNIENPKWKELEIILTQNDCKQMVELLSELLKSADQHFHISRKDYNENEFNDITISIEDEQSNDNNYTFWGVAIESEK